MTLYDVVGQQEALEAAVENFYGRVLADSALSPLFAETPMPRLKGHMVRYLAAALGGPQDYTGRDMSAAHAGRGITDEHFDRVVGHLAATLTELQVDPGVLAALAAHADAIRPQIVDPAATGVTTPAETGV